MQVHYSCYCVWPYQHVVNKQWRKCAWDAVSPSVLAGRNCQSPQSWWHCAWGCKGGCSQAWGRSGWCWARAWPGRAAPCTAAEQTCVSGWARRRGSWCYAGGHTGCRREAQTPGTGGYGTWSASLSELRKQIWERKDVLERLKVITKRVEISMFKRTFSKWTRYPWDPDCPLCFAFRLWNSLMNYF